MPTMPLVSFLLFSYKQEEYVREAVRGAFAQTYEPLEIILSDDCSPDQTFATILEEVHRYRGPKKVIVNRNKVNLGLANHINRVFEISKGDFFVMAAGDDISVPERTELMVNRWLEKNDPVDLVCSFFEEINVEGKSTGFVKKNTVFTPDINLPVQQWKCGATGACAGYSRILFDKYGPLDANIIAEDWVLSFRAWVESGIGLIEKPLVRHRSHDRCLSIIYRDISAEKRKFERALLRKKSSEGQLAQAKEWLRALQLAGKLQDARIEVELKQWVAQLELECQAYDSGRLQAFKAAIKSLRFDDKGTRALRIILRNVLRYY